MVGIRELGWDCIAVRTGIGLLREHDGHWKVAREHGMGLLQIWFALTCVVLYFFITELICI